MKKILPITQQVDFESECWNTLRLAILMNDKKYMPWYLEKFNNYFVDENFVFHFYRWSTTEFYSNYDEVLIHKEILDKRDIIHSIIDAINRNGYVTLYVDRYYIKGTLEYQKVHKVHGNLVFGYDTDNETVEIFDNNINGLWWGVSSVPFEDMKTAFESCIQIISADKGKYNWIYENNLPASIIFLKDFDRGIRLEAFYTAIAQNLIGGEIENLTIKEQNHYAIRRYGVSCYKSFYEDLYELLKEKKPNFLNEPENQYILIKLKAMIECKNSLLKKLNYINESGVVQIPEEIIQKAQDLCKIVNKAFLLLSKFSFNLKAKKLDEMRDEYKHAEQVEKELLTSLKNCLEQQYMYKKLELFSDIKGNEK